MKLKKISAMLLACGAATIASAQLNVPVGIDVGIFMPSKELIRDVFGDSWFRIGLSPLSFQTPGNWRFTFDLGYLHRSEGGDDVTLVPLTFGMTKSFGSDPKMLPYVAARIGPYWGDVDSITFGVHESKVGFNANVAVGVSFDRRFYLEARYDHYSEMNDLDFSGFSIAAGIRLFDIKI
ncbi:MAG TPA: outer membrane beta-barrel protein [Fimbriimonadales bacterium]|jgi:hypothetical protein|nr:outer membrane beta-barrel protein [Fimbriimonadales bacterium]